MMTVRSSEEESGPVQGSRRWGVGLLLAAMEAVVLLLVILSPWAFGSARPLPESLLYAGVAVLLGLWGVRVLVEGRFCWQKCSVALCLAGLVLLGVWQLTPLPAPVLSALSPGTARLYGEFFPDRHEELRGGEQGEAAVLPAGATISVYPGGTRREVLRLLAVFLLFAAVRNNLARPACLWRLSCAALVNGSLLALFALIQFYTSPHNTVYWTFTHFRATAVFGPFICRDHFAFYANLCVGLGVGLLLYLRSAGRRDSAAYLPRKAALWVVAGLALLMGSIALCLSRGGMLALAGGALTCLALAVVASRRFPRVGPAVLVILPAFLLVLWLGLGPVVARLGTLTKTGVLQNERLFMLTSSPPLVRAFPVWGTGYGTLGYAERLYRIPGGGEDYILDHAHNDYVEALDEGGVVRLVLSLVAIGLVFRLGYRALRRHAGQGTAGLVLGALFGFATVVIHSSVDFGLHIPAIALLATVVSAQLCGLCGAEGSTTPGSVRQGTAGSGAYCLRVGGLAPVAGLAILLSLGFVLCREGWRKAQAERFRLAAAHLRNAAEPGAGQRQLAYVDAAVRWAPEDASLQSDLADMHYDRFREGERRLRDTAEAAAAAQGVTAGLLAELMPGTAHPALSVAPTILVAGAVRQGQAEGERRRLEREHLFPALRHYLQARDLCPLLPNPHLRIAASRAWLASSDTPAAYRERAKRLHPAEADFWYHCGEEEIRAGRFEEAWLSWRQSLAYSERHLTGVLDGSGKILQPPEILVKVVPDDPRLLVMAVLHLFPDPADAGQRPALEKALALLTHRPGPWQAADLHAEAVIHERLGQLAKALSAYRAAVALDPGQASWHWELAQLLHQQGRTSEAMQELLMVLRLDPGQSEARELLRELRR